MITCHEIYLSNIDMYVQGYADGVAQNYILQALLCDPV